MTEPTNGVLSCPICSTEPRQVDTDGHEYECPNENCEVGNVRLLYGFFLCFWNQEEVKRLGTLLAASEERVKQLEAEILEWESDEGLTFKQLHELEKDHKELEKKLQTAQEALEKYGYHEASCNALAMILNRFKCDCGFEEALLKIKGETK